MAQETAKLAVRILPFLNLAVLACDLTTAQSTSEVTSLSFMVGTPFAGTRNNFVASAHVNAPFRRSLGVSYVPQAKCPPRTDAEVRKLLHLWFYDRYKKGRGERGKNGVSAKITVIRSEMKQLHEVGQSEIARSLTYLIDQGWIRKDEVHRSYSSANGANYSSGVTWYRITADGVDRIEGTGEYTMPKFHGININATGQNMITVGDNNQVDAKFESIANKLIEFKDAVRNAADVSDSHKVSIIADVDTMESQLAKPEPNRTVLRAIWAGIEKITTTTSLAANVTAIAPVLAPLLR